MSLLVAQRMRRIALTSAGASIVLTLVGVGLLWLNGQPLLAGFRPHLVLVGTLFAAIGGLIAARLPANRLGWVMSLGSLFWAISLFGEQYAWFATFTRPGLPAAMLAAWVQAWIWIPGIALLITGLPLLFPDGRLPSPRWRPVTVVVVAGTAIATVSQAIGLWGESASEILIGSTDVSEMPGMIGYIAIVGQILVVIVGPLAGVAALVVRSRRSVGIERQQMRWFTYAVVITVVTVICDVVFLPTAGVTTTALTSIVGFVLIPLAMGVAILRYHLYDIDRIVSRTIGYLIVTGILAVVFVGAVLAFGALLSPVFGENPVAVAASTLVVAALFQPLRVRVQRVVDRRFYRARYDAQRTSDAFASRLRDEVDLAALDADLAAVVRRTLAPASLGLWLHAKEGSE